MNYVFVVFFALVAILLLAHLIAYLDLKEGFMSSSRLYLSGPTKCFSCERQMINTYGPEYAWMGKQSKCFSCERQLASINPDLANYTHGTKCFDCEKELATELLPGMSL